MEGGFYTHINNIENINTSTYFPVGKTGSSCMGTFYTSNTFNWGVVGSFNYEFVQI